MWRPEFTGPPQRLPQEALCSLALLQASSRNQPRPDRAALGIDDFGATLVKCVFYHEKKAKRDDDNALASMKAAFDGFQDAKLIENDNGFKHETPEFRIDAQYPRVELEIQEIP